MKTLRHGQFSLYYAYKLNKFCFTQHDFLLNNREEIIIYRSKKHHQESCAYALIIIIIIITFS